MKRAHIKTIALTAVVYLACMAAHAQFEDRPRRNMPPGDNVAGTVSSVAKDSVTITPLRGGDPVTIKVSDATRVMKDREPAKLSDLKVGDVIFARGNLNGNAMDAQMLGVIPPEMAERFKQGGAGFFIGRPGQQGGNPQAFNPEDMGKKFIAGEVKAINETRLTIARPDGQSQDIEVDENTSFKRGAESITLPDIKVGDFVRGPGELKGNIFMAKELRVGRMQMRLTDPKSLTQHTPADKPGSPGPPN
jgi:hypothetical protein